MLILLDPQSLQFPPVDIADDDGLLAIGGDLSPERILAAYKNGIFPWYNEEEPICWWSPDPRCVLFPQELVVSKSMRTVLNKGALKFTINRCFPEVISQCRNIDRKGQPGTWLNDEMVEAYTNLHNQGIVHSAEAWLDGKLVGGTLWLKIR